MSSSSNPHRTFSAAPRKRRERDGGVAAESATAAAAAHPVGIGRPEPGSNRLLAGYLAREFLAHGTLFGQKWDPARAEATPLAAPPDPKKAKAKAAASSSSSPTRARPHAYADVARLLKTQGAHVEGIVNPSELARWLQI